MRQLDVVYNSTKTVQKNSQNASGFRIYTQHYPQAIQQFFLYDNKKIDFTTLDLKPTFIAVDTLGAVSCSGGSCEITAF